MILQVQKRSMSPRQVLALEHEVDETLHRLLPNYEQALRRRFNLSGQKKMVRTPVQAKRCEIAALRALRRMTLAPQGSH